MTKLHLAYIFPISLLPEYMYPWKLCRTDSKCGSPLSRSPNILSKSSSNHKLYLRVDIRAILQRTLQERAFEHFTPISQQSLLKNFTLTQEVHVSEQTPILTYYRLKCPSQERGHCQPFVIITLIAEVCNE